MHKLFILILVTLIISFTGCNNKAPVSNIETTNASTKKEVVISKEQALDSLVKSHSNEDLRPNKGYLYDGVNDKSGYYKFSWANPGKGTGASFEVDPYTADVYNMGKKVSNLFDSSKYNVNKTTKKDIVITFDNLNFNLSKTLDINQLEFLDSKQLAILRNSIYAQYGYSFTSKEYHEYFTKYSWYSPISSNVESKFNNTDRYNIDLLVNLEKIKSLDRTSELTGDFNELSTFWNNLRNSVLNKDLDAIEKLTQFPLETRGPMDYHPIIKFDRDKFKEVFLLFIDDNYTKIKDSEELYFKNKEDYDKPLDRTKFKDYTKIILVNNDITAICSMGFKFKDSRWKLTSLYLSKESYKRLGIDINKK